MASYLEHFQGTFAGDAGPWFKGLIEMKEGTLRPKAYVDRLAKLNRIGTSAIITAFDAMKGHYGYIDIANMTCMEFLASRLDSRPLGRLVLGHKMWLTLYDSNKLETLYTSGLSQASTSNPSVAAWFASYNGDGDTLRELSADANNSPGVRTNCLHYLESLNEDKNAELHDVYQALVDAYPNEWSVHEALYRYHFDRKEYEAAREPMEAWLDRGVKTLGLEAIQAHGNIANTYYASGQYEEALAALKPVADSAAFMTRSIRTRTLCKLGREEEALEAGQFLMQRFQSTQEALGEMLRVYWTFGHDDEAVKAITENSAILNFVYYKSEIWPTFIEIVGKDTTRLHDICVKLTDAGLEWDGISTLLAALAKHDAAGLAAELCQSEYEKNPRRKDLLIYSYEYFDKMGQKEAGLEWIKKNLTAVDQFRVAPLILRGDNYELLWDLIDNPDAQPRGKYVWVFRSAAAAEVGPKNDPHYQDLVDHLAKAGDGFYPELCRVLIGLKDEDQLLDRATNMDEVCEACCYLGLMHEGKGELKEAVRWYRLSEETRQSRNFEYAFVHDKLMAIAGKEKSLARLEKERTSAESVSVPGDGGPS